MDLFKKCYDYKEAEWAKKRDLYPYFAICSSVEKPIKNIENKDRIMMGSSNYLGLADNPQVLAAGHEALDKYGSGCAGSRFLNGTLDLHVALEEEIANFICQEEVIVYGTGFMANLGAISAIATLGDYILGDKECHASIYDACRLSYSKCFWYKHNDMEDLERLLVKLSGKGGILIVTDGVFSMSGEIANIPELVKLARKYDARLMVDDAHGFGVLGDGGRGVGNMFGLQNDVDIYMGALSKAFASEGGFIAGKKEVIEYIKHNSRPFIFSSSSTPVNTATALAALKYLENHPELPKRLLEMADYSRNKMLTAGLKLKHSTTQIIPIYTYDMENTFSWAREIYNRGCYVNTVMPPAAETCLLRTACMASFTHEIIDQAVDIITSVIPKNLEG